MTKTKISDLMHKNFQTLRVWFDVMNVELFEGKLPAVTISVTRKSPYMGTFQQSAYKHRNNDETIGEIVMNAEWFKDELVAAATLLHEMCHSGSEHTVTHLNGTIITILNSQKKWSRLGLYNLKQGNMVAVEPDLRWGNT